MDSDASPTPAPLVPRNTPFASEDVAFEPTSSAALSAPVSVATTAAHDRGERNGVFGHLVKDDADIAGLVAYSIYKQHKLDWLRAFESAKRRAPDDNELASYIIGEGTPRRLATYRHLAEATLAGNGPDVNGAAPPSARPALNVRRLGSGQFGASYPVGMLALYGLIALLFVFGFYLAMHYTATTR